MYKSMFRPEVIRRDELCFFRPCKTSIPASDVRNPPRGFLCLTLNFCLYKPCAMCLIWLHFQPCAGSEPDCNCCLSNKYTYMQLRSPEVTRVNFHPTHTHTHACTHTTHVNIDKHTKFMNILSHTHTVRACVCEPV